MSFLTQSVPLTTDGSGAVTRDVRVGGGLLLAVEVELGDLDTPDITLTDEPGAHALLAVTGLAADARYQLAAQNQKTADGTNQSGAFTPPVVMGRIHVVVAGGGATKTGRLVLLLER